MQDGAERIISECVLAEGLEKGDLARIAGIARTAEFADGDLIIREDDTSRDIFIIEEGWVSVEMQRYPYDMGSQRLRLFKHRGIVGEFSFVDKSRRSANVVAHGDVRAVILPGGELEDLLNSDSRLGYLFMRNVARLLCVRLRNTNFELRNQLIW
jgi:CRP-like cAMP-binding protein